MKLSAVMGMGLEEALAAIAAMSCAKVEHGMCFETQLMTLAPWLSPASFMIHDGRKPCAGKAKPNKAHELGGAGWMGPFDWYGPKQGGTEVCS